MSLLDEIKAEETRCKPLTDRQDADMQLIDMVKSLWVLRDASDDPKKIPNSIYVPLNDLKVFVNTVEAYLFDSEEQVVVTSEDSGFDTAPTEAIIKAIWQAVDDRWSQGIGTAGKSLTFSPFTFQQTTRRGRTSGLCFFRIEDGELVADMRAWDSRYTRHKIDDKGLLWQSYLTNRTIADIEAEYPQISGKLPGQKETLLPIRNIWTRKENIVMADEQEVLRVPHDYGYVPGVIQIVPLGSMQMDANSIAYEGESLLLMVRDIFPELVRLASIAQTLNLYELDHALFEKVEKEDLDVSEPPKHDDVTNPRAVTKTTGGFFEVPIGQLRQQAYDLSEKLELRMQRGGLSNFDTGTFNQQMSGIGLLTVGQGRKKVYDPRLSTHGLAKKNLTYMAIKQILHEAKKYGKKSLKIGRQTFDISILKEEFDLEFKYTVKDTAIEAAKQSMAVSQRGLIPRKSILRDTLGRDDPDGDERELYSEEAEVRFPNIKRKRILKALAEKSEKGDEDAQLDLEIGLAELGMTIDQLFAGQMPPEQPPAEAGRPTPPMVDLFGKPGAMTQQGGGSL